MGLINAVRSLPNTTLNGSSVIEKNRWDPIINAEIFTLGDVMEKGIPLDVVIIEEILFASLF